MWSRLEEEVKERFEAGGIDAAKIRRVETLRKRVWSSAFNRSMRRDSRPAKAGTPNRASMNLQ
jgi:hypothetical protein